MTEKPERERAHAMATEHRERKKKKKKEEAENQFHRLPEDVVVNIFDKLSDVQSLCSCFLVSKQFSSLVPLVQTLSVKASPWNYLSTHYPKSENPPRPIGLGNFLPDHSFFLIDNLVIKPLRYLQVKQLQSLNLDLVSDFDAHTDDSVFKWGAKFTSNLVSFTYLYAASLSKATESELDGDETEDGDGTDYEMFPVCVQEAVLWVCMLRDIIDIYPTIRSVTINDSNKKGVKVCLGREELLGMRVMKPSNETPSTIDRFPVLQLPISGYVMKEVTTVNFIMRGNGDYDADTAMLDTFAQEQGVFPEAAVQIVKKKHQDGIKANFRN